MLPRSRSKFLRLPALLFAVATAALLTACSTWSPRPATPISEVVKWSQELPPEQVIKRIRTSKTSYVLRGSDFGKLADAGVQPAVLDYLQQSLIDDLQIIVRYYLQGDAAGGCVSCYPQPVDLKSLDSGGNGMADTAGLRRYNSFARPRGVPDWVPVSPGGFNAPGITVEEIEKMVKDGVPAEQVVAKIHESRLRDVIGVAGITKLGTNITAGLSGSELARLHKESVPDSVLDALQEKFLAEYLEFTRLRYMNIGSGAVRP